MKFSSNSLRRRHLAGMVLACLLCEAQAQEAGAGAAPDNTQPATSAPAAPIPVPTSEPSDGKSSAQLAEVVVTATKRATPVRAIPGTVTVLSGEELERQGVQDLQQILAQVPGVNLDQTGTGGYADRVTIRGISGDNGTNLTAGTLIGDIPVSDPYAPKVQIDPNPFDMATVEVLKGPQGTLFGGTGLNGMIRYVPQGPQLDRYRVKYFSQFTSYPGNGGSGWSEGGAINVPFADHSAAVRVMGFYRADPGYIDNLSIGQPQANSSAQYGFRAMLEWHPDKDWKVSMMGITQHIQTNDLAYADGETGQLSRNDEPRQSPVSSSYSLGNLGVQRSFSFGDLISQTSVFGKRFDTFLDASRAVGGALPVLGGADTNRSEGFTQEFRLVSSPSQAPWKYLVGAFMFDERLFDCANIGALSDFPLLSSIPPGLLGSLVTQPCTGNVQKLSGQLDIDDAIADVKLKEQALFGELTRELGSYWDVTVGARAYRTQSSGSVDFSGLLYNVEHPSGGGDTNAALIEHGLSPKASVIFHPTRDLRTYITVSRGFRFGGPQLGVPDPASSFPPLYKSDSLWNYEWGVRTDWFQRTLRFDASLYHIRWKNPQVFQVTKDTLSNYIDNVGGAKGDGADMELRYKPRFLYGLSLVEAASWNHTVTTEPFLSSSGKNIVTGSPWPLAPHWQTSTTLAYDLPLGSWLLDADLRHTYSASACNLIDCTAKVFGYHTLNANLSLSPQEDSWWPQLSMAMTNITDTRGKSDIQVNALNGPNWTTYIPPRMLVLRLSGQF